MLSAESAHSKVIGSAVRSEQADPLELGSSYSQPSLVRFARNLGLSFTSLPPDQLGALIAAHNMSQYVEKLRIPTAKRIDDVAKKILVEREIERVLPKTSYERGGELVPYVADDKTRADIDSVAEMAWIDSSDLALGEECEELLLYNIVQGNLQVDRFIEYTYEPRKSDELTKLRELIEQSANPQYERQHACVLLDTSGSMDGATLTVAKGFAIAFLYDAYCKRSLLSFRSFTEYTGEPTTALGEIQFFSLIKEVIQLRAGGGTNVNGALQSTCRSILSDPDCKHADILLITDGDEAPLTSPLGSVGLHSCIVREGGINAAVCDRLKSWSKNYFEFSPSQFSEYLSLSQHQYHQMGAELGAAFSKVDNARSIDEFLAARELLQHGASEAHALALYAKQQNAMVLSAEFGRLASEANSMAESLEDESNIIKRLGLQRVLQLDSELAAEAEKERDMTAALDQLQQSLSALEEQSKKNSDMPATQEREQPTQQNESNGKSRDKIETANQEQSNDNKLSFWQRVVRDCKRIYSKIMSKSGR